MINMFQTFEPATSHYDLAEQDDPQARPGTTMEELEVEVARVIEEVPQILPFDEVIRVDFDDIPWEVDADAYLLCIDHSNPQHVLHLYFYLDDTTPEDVGLE